MKYNKELNNGEINIVSDKEINLLYENIKELVEQSRNRVYKTVNVEMINLYWNIGKMIVNIQERNNKTKYKDYITEKLSIKLSDKFGKGFSKRNLERMRKFYLYYPITTTMLSQLSWSHYLESDLEKNILEHLKDFLLELGKALPL